MERLSERHSIPVHLRALRVQRIRLAGRPETAGLAGEVEAERVRMRDAWDAHEEAEARRQAATLHLYYRDDLLDAGVRQLSLDALAACGGDRDAAAYKALFVESPSAAMKDRATVEQDRYVQHVLATLDGASAEPLSGLAAKHAAPLRQQLTEVDEARKERDEALVKESQALVALRLASEDARRVYNGLHARLSVQFPEQDKLVESFFADL
jgi:hypothetical protein